MLEDTVRVSQMPWDKGCSQPEMAKFFTYPLSQSPKLDPLNHTGLSRYVRMLTLTGHFLALKKKMSVGHPQDKI